MWLCNRSLLNLLIYEENCIFFFINVLHAPFNLFLFSAGDQSPNFIAANVRCNTVVPLHLHCTGHRSSVNPWSALYGIDKLPSERDGPVEGEAKKDEGSRSSMELNVIMGIIFMVAGRPSWESIEWLVGFGRACSPVRCAHPSFWAL
jgi:hypothetical protein